MWKYTQLKPKIGIRVKWQEVSTIIIYRYFLANNNNYIPLWNMYVSVTFFLEVYVTLIL